MAHSYYSVTEDIAIRDFGKRVFNKLGKLGITFIGLQAIPDMTSDLPYANAERGYVINDNGTGKVETFTELLKRVNNG